MHLRAVNGRGADAGLARAVPGPTVPGTGVAALGLGEHAG
jgi:hypothetical protein